ESRRWVDINELDDSTSGLLSCSSAEDVAMEGEDAGLHLVHSRLAGAARAGTITPLAARIIWRTRISGEPDEDVATDFPINGRAPPTAPSPRRRPRSSGAPASAANPNCKWSATSAATCAPSSGDGNEPNDVWPPHADRFLRTA